MRTVAPTELQVRATAPGTGLLRTPLIVGVVAVVVSVALKVAFDAYVADRFGYWDDDAIGLTPFLWVIVTIVVIPILAIASGVQGTKRRWLRVAGGTLVATLWFFFADNLIGAFRDGVVSPAGIGIGALALAQVVVLTLWTGMLWRTDPAAT